jgi:hypothetical protein
MVHLQPLVPAILEALPVVKPGQLHRIGGINAPSERPADLGGSAPLGS